jgi:hypothetical protein
MVRETFAQIAERWVLGSDAQAGCRWAVSLCPQSDDKRSLRCAGGLALIWGSWVVGAWALLFIVVNHTYFVLSEEPGLSDASRQL